MISTYPLEDVLGPRSKITILRLLLRTRGEYTGRDLARGVGLDHKTCHAALQDLADQGIVDCRRVGRALVYRLNGDHVVVREILAAAFEKESQLLKLLADDVRQRLELPLKAIVLFGSVAQERHGPKSDLDLLVVTRDARAAEAVRRKAPEAISTLARRHGRVPEIHAVDVHTFRRAVSRGQPPLYGEIFRTGRVLYGLPLERLVKRGA